jgi:ankyrin repeat protein
MMRSPSNFMKAARAGNAEFVEGCLQSEWRSVSSYAFYKDDKSNTALHALAQGGLDRFMQTMFDQKVDVNARNLAGETPLYTAVQYQKADVVGLLLASGASHAIGTTQGMYPLDVAAMRNNLVIVRQLLTAGADVNNPNRPLLEALQNGAAEVALALLTAGAKIDVHDNSYRSPLHFAASCGALDALKKLLDGGADINARDSQGQTPLHYAAQNNGVLATELLLARGAAKDIEDVKGRTALSFAREKKNAQLIKVLDAAPAAPPRPDQAPTPVASPQPDTPAPQKPADTGGGSENWVLVSETKAAQVGDYPALNRRITEIFNFATRERLIITENLKTGAETQGAPESFDRIPEAAVQAASAAFARLGGVAPPKKALNL